MSASQLFHTVRALRARQIAGRLRNYWRGLAESPAAFLRRPVPPPPACRWRPRTVFPAPGAGAFDPAELRAGRFRFLNRAVEVGFPPRWNEDGPFRLWRYNLHYFEYLWALPYADARACAGDWIARHPLRADAEGWEPYPVSLRLQNWCAYFFGECADSLAADPEFRARLWESIHRQAEWLGRHLETHLLGNHLFENGATLALLGSCFEGEAAERWRAAGRDILEREIPEQVLPDGGHFERSPMYQARAAFVLASLLNTGCSELDALVREPLGRMLQALAHLCHPDGEIALLNDSAVGIANSPAALLEQGRRLGVAPVACAPGVFELPATGYYGARSATGDYVVCDAAPIGPDYNPGHAHGDIFSFELSLGGQRVITDAGVFGYEADEMRRYCRSTRAHNTVEVDGQDQCEFWAVFRVGRRGRPHDVRFEASGGGFSLSGWHDGYRRLPGRPRHDRRLRWSQAGELLLEDSVGASRSVRVDSRLHLHPDCSVASLSSRSARVEHPAGAFQVHCEGDGALSREPSYYCPEFGLRLERSALVVSASGARVDLRLRVESEGS